MTREEAIYWLENGWNHSLEGKYREAFDLALSSLRPVSREQVEKAWRSEWEDMRETYKDIPKYRCAQCRGVFIGLETSFCPACGASTTDEAVETVMERLEAMRDETETD